MLPVNCGSHADYQNFVVTNLRKYYPNPNALARSTWDIIERFWNLDLSFTDTFMADKYSKFGPAPRTPSCMQRSYLLSIDFKVTSLTEWAAQLKMNPLYAILSGFEVGNTPGVGTFYDFFNRLWDSDDDHMSPHIHPLKTKVKKPKTKGTKADSVEKVTVADLLPTLEKTDFKLDEQPYSSLFKIYQKEFLEISVSAGLIHADSLALAGDGTPVVTSHRERKKRICNCKENGIHDCNCDRYFSQPDCDIGWDSSRDCYYHGYDLYMLVDSQSDLPVFPHFSCASKHDSHGFLHAFFRMKSFLPDYSVSKVLLDAAHDAMPYYQYFKRKNITPFIDLNGKGGRPPVYKNDFTIDKDVNAANIYLGGAKWSKNETNPWDETRKDSLSATDITINAGGHKITAADIPKNATSDTYVGYADSATATSYTIGSEHTWTLTNGTLDLNLKEGSSITNNGTICYDSLNVDDDGLIIKNIQGSGKLHLQCNSLDRLH